MTYHVTEANVAFSIIIRLNKSIDLSHFNSKQAALLPGSIRINGVPAPNPSFSQFVYLGINRQQAFTT